MKNYLMIPLGEADHCEFCEALDMAIQELFLILFERRALDLQENQTYALYILTDFQVKLKQALLKSVPSSKNETLLSAYGTCGWNCDGS